MYKVLEDALLNEEKRQNSNIELIASENFVSKDILKLQGSCFTNKYAEGYPQKRYYGGCKYIDIGEQTAIDLAKELFQCKYANVQPHSGSSANMIAFRVLCEKGDKVLSMSLDNGGHLTHGHNMSFSGQDYQIFSYGLNDKTEKLDYNKIEDLATIIKPKMIIAGASAYSRIIDFKKFREIANKVGAKLLVDMAHISGLVATGYHISPIPYADIVTTTTHKTLRGPRGGLILTNDDELIKKINQVTFPGIQGGGLQHIIIAKAQCFYEALQPEFKSYIKNVIDNAKAMSKYFIDNDFKVVSGGTDNHMFLLNTKYNTNLTGKEVQDMLDEVNITLNKNMIHNDTESPTRTSGIRIGTPAMTTKGFTKKDFIETASLIIKMMKNPNNKNIKKEILSEVNNLINKH